MTIYTELSFPLQGLFRDITIISSIIFYLLLFLFNKFTTKIQQLCQKIEANKCDLSQENDTNRCRLNGMNARLGNG